MGDGDKDVFRMTDGAAVRRLGACKPRLPDGCDRADTDIFEALGADRPGVDPAPPAATE